MEGQRAQGATAVPATLQLRKIKFRAGPSPESAGLEIDPGTVLILVGPNNSGKSLALREIENWCFGQETSRKVIEALEVDFPEDAEDAERLVRQFETHPPPNQGAVPGQFWIGQHTFRADQPVRQVQISEVQLRRAVSEKDIHLLRGYLTASYTVRLDGRTRFSLADPKPTGDLQQHPQNHLWALFKDDAARQRVRQLTEEAFGLHFVVDPTGMQQFRIRMSSRPPTTDQEEQALDEAARTFHAQAQPIQELSDGVQAFVGLVAAVLSLPHKVILVDEPEAFLHPPLARRLGQNLALISRQRRASLVAATHSSEFLMGCVGVGGASIVRLTYDGGVATARVLASGELTGMTSDPLLRSSGALSALFHRAAVITESDTDRVFYEEMNRRLLSEGRGIKDAVFLNAQNKQTIRRMVGPLRRVGIPAVALVDLDLIKEGGSNWEGLLDACQVPPERRVPLQAGRHNLHMRFEELTAAPGVDVIKSQGLDGLAEDSRSNGANFLEELASYGLFLVPGGELESWLRHLGVGGHGADWLVNIFEKIGQSETASSYLKPGSDDIWAFLGRIAAWVDAAFRGGTG
jgi:ABC-type lipoprotein export system ATPase subunit